MVNQKIEILVKNYKSQNTKAIIIATFVCVIFYFFCIEILETGSLLWLMLIIFPIIIRITIIYNFTIWSTKLSKKYLVNKKIIKEIATKYKLSDRQFFQSKKEIIFFSFYSLVSLGITFWFLNVDNQIRKYGTETVAKVYQINSGIKNSYALLEYEVDEKIYTTSVRIQIGNNFSDRIYEGKKYVKVKIGQKFMIIYSRKNPEISRIITEYPLE